MADSAATTYEAFVLADEGADLDALVSELNLRFGAGSAVVADDLGGTGVAVRVAISGESDYWSAVQAVRQISAPAQKDVQVIRHRQVPADDLLPDGS